MADTVGPEPAEIFAKPAKSVYLGEEVDWALCYADGHKSLPGYARLMFRSRPSDVKYIAVDVPVADYPWLGRLRRNEPVQVRGRIAKVGSLSIELKDAGLLQLV